MAPAGVTKDLQCCAFRVYESPENHRAVISRPTFRFMHMVLNEGCKLPCGLWPNQTSNHTRMGAVVHMPTPAQVLCALFANISVHILSSSYSHIRQEQFLLFGPALVLLRCPLVQHQQWLSLEHPCRNMPVLWLQPTFLWEFWTLSFAQSQNEIWHPSLSVCAEVLRYMQIEEWNGCYSQLNRENFSPLMHFRFPCLHDCSHSFCCRANAFLWQQYAHKY